MKNQFKRFVNRKTRKNTRETLREHDRWVMTNNARLEDGLLMYRHRLYCDTLYNFRVIGQMYNRG